MILSVKHLIEQHHMLQIGDSVVVGVSGGADSLCLLRILVELQKEYHLKLLAVHIHHGIRGEEADADAAFTEQICTEWEVECRIVKKDIPQIVRKEGISEEEAGRIVRYETFEQICKKEGFDKIAVAHHLDDNAETILWNFLRGSGLRGLVGMEPVRGAIIRPLLYVTRAEIEQWMNKKKIPWRMDSTNNSTDYTRNQLRIFLLPWIEQNLVSGFSKRVTGNAGIFAEADDYFKEQAQMWIKQHLNANEAVHSFLLEEWRQLHPAVKRYVIRQEIDVLTGSLKDFTAEHAEAIMRLSGTGKQLDLPGHMQVWMDYERIYIGRKKKGISTYPKFVLESCCFPYKKGQKIIQNVYTKWFDYDKIKVGFELRTRKVGDRIQVLSDHGSKKIKDYMIDAKIPRELRDQIPVIADGNEIMWVVGYRMSEAYKVTDRTTTVLQIKLSVLRQ